ncbi:hypothetical protein C8J57DRAFT_1090264 [Mycena rebaudengoi]|nr:hypothetical protein C8J57DRAFT_1090264 [Mycena rebaudengoi]
MPTSQHTTIVAVSNPRIRRTESKPRAPLTSEEQREKCEARAERQEEIDMAVGEWFSYTYAKAEELAQRFKKTQRYFLDVFFQGGAHMVHHQDKVNAYNTFKSEKAAECRESAFFFILLRNDILTELVDSSPKRVDELHNDYYDEYLKLSDGDKAQLVERFQDVKNRDVKLRRNTPRGRIQDLANTVRNMQLMMVGLGHRVGIEGFFCIVRNNADFHAKPHWYFTSPELENYMKIACHQRWDTVQIGTKIEAFAVAGSDVLSESFFTCYMCVLTIFLDLLRTSKQKADFMKREVRDLVHEKLGMSLAVLLCLFPVH